MIENEPRAKGNPHKQELERIMDIAEAGGASLSHLMWKEVMILKEWFSNKKGIKETAKEVDDKLSRWPKNTK